MSDHHPSVLGSMPVEPHHVEPEANHAYPPTETPGARFRRVSSLAYHSSGLRESRERAVQRSSKFFVVVVPPPVLLQEHGQLGHTLSLGPRHRLSQGMLMPLFPTMYGQLAAIAKEFNFPSTTGICLYFHFTENGITVTPRISDDSWPVIWSNVLDPSAPPPRVPIVGKLEFDIDLRHARWYSAWISSAHRENLDVPASVGPSAAPSLAHFRGDSRTTDLEINLQDDALDSESISPPSGRFNRHVPRKLSLVDRLDSSLRSVARNIAQDASPEQSASVRALSPIFQEDEPKTAKLSDSLEKRVKSWRASASLTPSALAVKGQTSLEPANLPNTMPLDDVADEGVDELNLEDFAWSISSLGPNDWEDGSVASGYRLPSVHLEHRMAHSVAMTPSDCTSFGPSDYTLPSPVPSLERVFTPDIAHRMFEDCPPTPGTATSWGPPSEYPASPLSFGRASSIGLVDRLVFSPPPTPMTATSWGPPSEYPPSPVGFGRPPSLHLGDRVVFSAPMTPEAGLYTFHDVPFTNLPWGHAWPYTQESSESEPWGHVWPYNQQLPVSPSVWKHSWPYFHPVAAKSAPWAHVWPYQQQISVVPAVDKILPAQTRSVTVVKPWGHSWPYTASQKSQSIVWKHSWPYTSYTTKAAPTVSVHLPCVYPSLKIYPDVFPHFDIYPAEPRKADHAQYPHFDLYPALSSKHTLSSGAVEIKVGSAYPDFDIYPARFNFSLGSCGYPDFDLYPSLQSRSLPAVQVLQTVWNYPVFDLYPGVYPHIMPYPSKPSSPVVSTVGYPNFDIYPATQRQTVEKNVVVQVPSGYPDFEIYPQQFRAKTKSYGYPDFNIYPSLQSQSPQSQSLPAVRVLETTWGYPVFDLYPGVYPHVTPYPSKPSSRVYSTAGYPSFDIYPTIVRQMFKREVLVKVSSAYPDFEIYPSQIKSDADYWEYPRFNLYPPTSRASGQRPDVEVLKVAWCYPIFDLYPGVYPSIDPYPAQSSIVPASATAGYPVFDIYPDVDGESMQPCYVKVGSAYPYFEIYPVKHSRSPRPEPVADASSGKPTWGYPIFDLYPAVYPHLTPYPSPASLGAPNTEYPDFDIYPITSRESSRLVNVLVKGASAYPYFEIYPSRANFSSDLAKRSTKRPNPKPMRVNWSYPIFDLYPAVYPYISPYPSATSESVKSVPSRSSNYPDFVIYPCRQYPHFDLYHSLVVEKTIVPVSRSRYPVFELYPAVYPHVIPYPSIVFVSTLIVPSSVESTTAAGKNRVLKTKIVRKSHRTLHFEIFPNGLVETPSGTFFGSFAPVIRQKKSHSVLHNEVFPDGIVSTPSGTVSLRREVRASIRAEVPPRPVGGRVRSGSVSQRPLSSINPPAVIGLPPRPNFRLSTYQDSQPTPAPVHHVSSEAPSTSSGASLPSRSASLRTGPGVMARTSSDVRPLRRAASSATPTPVRTSSFRDTSGLAPLPEVDRPASFGIQKPALPNHLVDDSRPPSRKRESVVSQRIRAFEETGSDLRISRLFPLPPPPPPPTGGLPPPPSHRTLPLNQARP